MGDADLAPRVEYLARRLRQMADILGALLVDSLENPNLNMEDEATRLHMNSTLRSMVKELDELWPPRDDQPEAG
jgi:hypothetical protein